MALTNAERQARYRERLRAGAVPGGAGVTANPIAYRERYEL
jgi:hypothetical protein